MDWADPTAARVQHIARMLRYQDRLEVLYSHGITGRMQCSPAGATLKSVVA